MSGTGCAYLTTYNKQVDLGGVGAVAMDVKQRVVFSQSVTANKGQPDETKFIATCAEPSPDALTVLGASGGLSFSGGAPGADKTVNLTGAFAENGAFVGLRTQSIQLLRDQLYRLCEGYASGAVNDAEFKSMQRRFQSTVMGLLAIEQLTKPVVAGQAILFSSAQSQAGAGAGDAAVTAAQQRVDDQRQKVTDAQKELNTKKAAVAKDNSDIADNAAQVGAETAKDKDSTTIPSLVSAGKTLQAKLATDTTDQDNAALQLKKEEDVLTLDLRSLRQAQSRSTADAGGGGAFGAAARAAGDASASMASAVKDIVVEVNRSYTRDECLELMSRHAAKGAAPLPASLDALCVSVVQADAEDRRSLIEIRRIEAETKLIIARADMRQADERRERSADESKTAPKPVAPAAPAKKGAPTGPSPK